MVDFYNSKRAMAKAVKIVVAQALEGKEMSLSRLYVEIASKYGFGQASVDRLLKHCMDEMDQNNVLEITTDNVLRIEK